MSQPSRPAVIPALSYVDARAAFEWLQRAFGFEVEMLIEDEAGALVHSELRFGNGLVMVGWEWNESTRSPASVGRVCTQTVHLHLEEDIDAHCERARAAGAEIMADPEPQFYGDRTYRARDPEGHVWTFGQTVEAVSPDTWDKASGFTTTMGGA